MSDSQALRTHLRQRRDSLKNDEITRASAQVCEQLGNSALIHNQQHIAFYYAQGGEINPEALLLQALEIGKHCYLPVLHQDGSHRLTFALFQPGRKLRPNRYGIPEPVCKSDELIEAEQLDLALLPLVAYDPQGNRIGMGKGYYDRTFSFLKEQQRPGRPLLIGLAHSFQQVLELTPQSWDIALDGIVNECHLTLFTPGGKPEPEISTEKSDTQDYSSLPHKSNPACPDS